MRATTDKKTGPSGGGKKKENPLQLSPRVHTYAHTYVCVHNTHTK